MTRCSSTNLKSIAQPTMLQFPKERFPPSNESQHSQLCTNSVQRVGGDGAGARRLTRIAVHRRQIQQKPLLQLISLQLPTTSHRNTQTHTLTAMAEPIVLALYLMAFVLFFGSVAVLYATGCCL
ncbi:Hypothetical predicted protein [Cloeon dipterum]|uniref:Uncharacterized protein n=1 Tax=Cloeon dipterum TaxID=197152 RepID=A0A8S1DNA6_9INSE|nr:Hypothetical predicted protein [Cloeon dipterum]